MEEHQQQHLYTNEQANTLHPVVSGSKPESSAQPTPSNMETLPSVVERSEVEGTTRGLHPHSVIDADRRESLAPIGPASGYFSPEATLSSSSYHSQAASDPDILSRPLQFNERRESHPHALWVGEGAIQDAGGHSPSSPRSFLRSTPQRANTVSANYPPFPEQNLAALHQSQNVHHTSYHARNNSEQSRSSTTLPPSGSPRLDPSKVPPPRRVTRTAGNTPAQTPSLFPSAATIQPLNLDGSDGQAPFPSPYLHPVQAPPPRVTRSAQRDYDILSGNKMINQYALGNELGRGVHGKVKLAKNTHKDGEKVAIKIVQRFSKRQRLGRSNVPEDKVKKEIAILKKVQHPNVVRLIEVIDDPAIAKVYIVLEFCEQRELIWRTEGQPHIVLLEYLNQGKGGNNPSGESTNAEIETIHRRTERRRKRQNRQRLQAIQEGENPDDSRFWSLTYASDSDEDLAESQSMTSDLTPVQSGERRTPDGDQPSANLAIAEGEQTPTSTVDSTVVSPQAIPSSTQLSAPDDLNFGYSYYWNEAIEPAASNGPSRFPPSRDMTRSRQVSVAESSNSGLTDQMDREVPRDFRYVPTMTLDECRSAFRDALVGLEHLHHHGIIHRDIKPENLLRTKDNRVKISDFGVSYLGKPVRQGDDSAETSDNESEDLEKEADFAKTVGTPAFYAPEICQLDGDVEAPINKSQIDIWALGVTLFCMVFARTPFDAEHEFALMKRTREEEIWIPRKRLLPVDPTSRVRSPGHSPLYQNNKRNPGDHRHEAIDGDLYDLMERLFQKDPTKRITIQEIKHHPWTLKGIHDPAVWLDEMDPARIHHGQVIEVSNEDVEKAVAPLVTFDRIKSIGKRALSVLGIRSKRAQSSGTSTSSDTGSSAPAPEQGQGHVHERRMSVQPMPLAPIPQKASRDPQPEHPLSRSVAASPEPEAQGPHQLTPGDSLTDSVTGGSGDRGQEQNRVARPSMPDRHASAISTTGSIRTLRASDFERGRPSSTSPEFVERNESSHQHPTFGSIFGGAGRSLFKAMRSRDRLDSASSSPRRSPSVPVAPEQSSDRTTNAADTHSSGPIDLSRHLDESLSTIPDEPHNRRLQSRPDSSYTSAHDFSEARTHADLSTNSMDVSEPANSASNIPSRSQTPSPMSFSPITQHFSPVDPGEGASRGETAYTMKSDEGDDDKYQRAKMDMSRRRALQDVQDQELLESSRPSSAIGSQPCPPSPDDDGQQSQPSGASRPTSGDYFGKSAALSHPSITSSEHPSTSDITHSRSTSFPSVPSAVSANSSMYSDAKRYEEHKEDSANSSEGTTGTRTSPPRNRAPQIARHLAEDDGYQGDADGNGESTYACMTSSESESSEDEFLTMSKSKRTESPNASEGQVARARERRETAIAERKAGRSGSTNTMKKIRTHPKGDDRPDQEHLAPNDR